MTESTEQLPLLTTGQRGRRSWFPKRSVRESMGQMGRSVRWVAVLAWVAAVMAQGVAPALKASGVATPWLIEGTDIVGSVGSQLLVLVATVVAAWMVSTVGRDTRISLVARIALVAQTTIVVVLAAPSARFVLLPFACFFLGLVTCSVALVASFEALRQSRSRALAMVLGLVAIAALPRVLAVSMLAMMSPSKAQSFAGLASILVTLSVVVHGIAQLIAVAWFASRRKTTVSLATMAVLVATMAMVWISVGVQSNSPQWQVFISRTVEFMTPLPLSSLMASVDGFVAMLGPCAAVAALLSRGQMAAVVGGFSLVLTAGTRLDVPGHALTMLLASLAAVLAARDDVGMWETLLGQRLGATAKAGRVPNVEGQSAGSSV